MHLTCEAAVDYVQVCENIGLNPMMRPFAYIKSRELCRGIWVSEDRRAKACRLFNDEAAVPKSPESILEKSALAERHVRECRELVERQRALVARHKAAGRDASALSRIRDDRGRTTLRAMNRLARGPL